MADFTLVPIGLESAVARRVIRFAFLAQNMVGGRLGPFHGFAVFVYGLAADFALVPIRLEAAAASGVIRFVLFGAGGVGAGGG